MAFQKGHPPYNRRSRLLVAAEDGDVATLEHPTQSEAPIRRWAIADFDDWLLERLVHRWGGVSLAWQRKFLGFQSNDYLLITNEDAVLLAMQQRHVMIAQPICMEVFAWSRDATLKNGIYDSAGNALRPLYRQMKEWARGMNATRIYTGVCSDYPHSTVQEIMGRNSAYYIVGAPC